MKNTFAVLMVIWGLCGISSANETFRQVRPAQANVIEFKTVEASFLKFDIRRTQQGAPAIDELEVYGDGEENLARRDGVQVSATSVISGFRIHRIEHLNDGQYGNNASWVAADEATPDAPQSVQYSWPSPVKIRRVVFSRDRSGQFMDRVPLAIDIFVSEDGKTWTNVASLFGMLEETGGMTPYGSAWLQNLPNTEKIDLKRAEVSATRVPHGDISTVSPRIDAKLADYDRKLQDAFLAEEGALLKTAGFADGDPRLLQRHYPEYVEPKSQPENILPLVTLSDKPDFRAPIHSDANRAFWDHASAGTVWSYAPGTFAEGPLMEQTVRAAVADGCLYLRITGNRFRSGLIAMVSTENLPARSLFLFQENNFIRLQFDPVTGAPVQENGESETRFDAATLTFEAAIPLACLPECQTRGLYVSLGTGGRHTMPGGHPVHFRFGDFSLRLDRRLDEKDRFVLCGNTVGDKSMTLGDWTFEPNRENRFPVETRYGQVGPEAVVEMTDRDGNLWRVVGFQYDPCYRPLCLLTDALRRQEATESENLEAIDYQKRSAIPGVLNPRYSNPEKIVADLNLPEEKTTLEAYCAENEATDGASDDERVQTVKKGLIPLWKEYQRLKTARQTDSGDFAAERELFRKIRLLKRNFFLTGDGLEPVEHLLANQRHPFHPSHNYSDLFDSPWRPGGGVVLIDIPRVDGRLAPEQAVTRVVVSAGDGVIRNPAPSFDATKIYYALRASKEDYFRIYELDLTTNQTRRISADGPFHDFWPTELPDGGLAFISTRCKKKFICWRPQAFVLHRMNQDGGDITPLSFANLTEFAPSVMNDGRILWTRSEYVDKGADYGHTLWTIRVDGTMPELVFGNTINLPQGYANGREVPETREVCSVMISHFGDLNGPVTLLDLSKGPHDASIIRSITPEVPWPGFSALEETFREPFPITRDLFLVSHAPAQRFGLYLIDRFGNRELLTLDDAIDTVCPQPLAKRDVPPILRGGINPELAKNGMGQFSIMNVYRGLEGQVEPGRAKFLRVCREMPTPLAVLPDGTYQADHEPFMEYYASPIDLVTGPYGWPSYVAKGVVGTVEIEKDGSANFLAPAGEVLFFQLLDENYNEIQRMRSVVQLQNGETRACIGCHESRLSTPEGTLTMASKKPASTPQTPPWGAGPFWFEKMVQPVLDRRCTECHTAETAAKSPRQFDLTGRLDHDGVPASYRSLIQSGDIDYFDYTWGGGKTTKAAPYSFGTSKSRLWEILRNVDHATVHLTPEEEQAIKCWTDLNVPLWGDYQFRRDRHRPADGEDR